MKPIHVFLSLFSLISFNTYAEQFVCSTTQTIRASDGNAPAPLACQSIEIQNHGWNMFEDCEVSLSINEDGNKTSLTVYKDSAIIGVSEIEAIISDDFKITNISWVDRLGLVTTIVNCSKK